MDPSTRGGDFYLATTGDLDLATSGNFLMATDIPPAVRRARLAVTLPAAPAR